MPKLITEPMDFTGLDPQIAEELRKGNKVWGIAWDEHLIYRKHVNLIGYNKHFKFPYITMNDDKEESCYLNFAPIYEEEVDWSKVERDTKIIVKDGMGNSIHHHFARYDAEKGAVIVYDRGMSSLTCMHDTRPCDPSRFRLAKEGE